MRTLLLGYWALGALLFLLFSLGWGLGSQPFGPIKRLASCPLPSAGAVPGPRSFLLRTVARHGGTPPPPPLAGPSEGGGRPRGFVQPAFWTCKRLFCTG